MSDSGFEDDDALPISGLQHLAFCPRQWALIHLEQVWVENMRTAEGRLLHERADLPGESRRGNLRTVRGMWLRSERLRLTGRADIVEFRPEPFPVEYKRGKSKPTDCDTVQLCAQALCLEEMLQTAIPRGAIFYGNPRRRQEIVFTPELRARTEELAATMHRLYRNRETPPAQPGTYCSSCSLVHVCLPKATEQSRRCRALGGAPSALSPTGGIVPPAMRKLLNTLHVMTQGAYLHRDGETVAIRIGEELRLRVPVHTLEGLVCWGQVACSPPLLGLCCERGVGISFLTEQGRFLARVTGPVSGNVLLRRQQYRMADGADGALPAVRTIVAAKDRKQPGEFCCERPAKLPMRHGRKHCARRRADFLGRGWKPHGRPPSMRRAGMKDRPDRRTFRSSTT